MTNKHPNKQFYSDDQDFKSSNIAKNVWAI